MKLWCDKSRTFHEYVSVQLNAVSKNNSLQGESEQILVIDIDHHSASNTKKRLQVTPPFPLRGGLFFVHTRHSPAMRLGWFGPIHAGEFERAWNLFRTVLVDKYECR